TKMFSLPCSMFQLLMEVETLLLTPTTPQLRIWTAKLYPLTLFFSFSPNPDYLHYGTLLQDTLTRSPSLQPATATATATQKENQCALFVTGQTVYKDLINTL